LFSLDAEKRAYIALRATELINLAPDLSKLKIVNTLLNSISADTDSSNSNIMNAIWDTKENWKILKGVQNLLKKNIFRIERTTTDESIKTMAVSLKTELGIKGKGK
jgi:hypothetical protein